MRIGICHFNENDFKKFLYVKNGSHIQNIATWLNRLIYFIPTATWVNSEKVIQILFEEKKRCHRQLAVCSYFQDVNLNMEQKAKIGKIFDHYVRDILTKISPFTSDYQKISTAMHPCVPIIQKAIYGTLKWEEVTVDDQVLNQFIENTNTFIKNYSRAQNLKQLLESKLNIDELMKIGRWKDYSFLKILRKIVKEESLSNAETELLNQRLFPIGPTHALDEFIRLNPRARIQLEVD